MYTKLVVAAEQLFICSDSLRIFGEMVAARIAIDTGDNIRAVNILRPYLDSGNAEAEYLYAKCPIGESVDQLEKRHIEYLNKSATNKYPPAIYLLGAYYDSGDYYNEDKQRAAELFSIGAALGHSRCQWIHGEDLIYGRNGIRKNEALGLTLIQEAAAAKLLHALETMVTFYENGLCGLPKDSEKVNFLRNQMLGHDVIRF